MGNDRYQEIRKALEMGPTPGPRKWWEHEDFGYCWVNPRDGGLWIAKCDVRDPFDQEQRGNAALIAACDPDTIRALLAERDDLLENGKQAIRWAPSSAHWSNELKRLFGDDARLGIDALESQLRNAQVERDALRDALETIAAYPYSRDQEMGATAMRKVARDSLAAQPAASAEHATCNLQLATQAPAANGDALDAARYRWLRTRWGRITEAYAGDSNRLVEIREVDDRFEGWDVSPESLDAAIDAAMAAKEGE